MQSFKVASPGITHGSSWPFARGEGWGSSPPPWRDKKVKILQFWGGGNPPPLLSSPPSYQKP